MEALLIWLTMSLFKVSSRCIEGETIFATFSNSDTSVPYDMKYNNALGWIAFANQGGKFSFYNDANILNAQTMVHEIGKFLHDFVSF